jgi:hypothetical protein
LTVADQLSTYQFFAGIYLDGARFYITQEVIFMLYLISFLLEIGCDCIVQYGGAVQKISPLFVNGG